MKKQQVTVLKPWTNRAMAFEVESQPTIEVYDAKSAKEDFAPNDLQIDQATYDSLVASKTIAPVEPAAPAPAAKGK